MTASVPVPPRDWSAETRRWWRDFWASEQGQRLPTSMHPTVRRLFGWYHRRSLLERRVDRLFAAPRTRKADPLFVEGSTGQPKVNPLVAELRSIEDQIEQLERRVFGSTSSTTGGSTGDGADPAGLLAAATARLIGAEGEHQPADPRLELVEGGAA